MGLKRQAMIGKRGQVVIPEPIRDAFDLRPGTVVNFSLAADHISISSAPEELDAFVDAMDKRPEPATIDWDERYYARAYR